MPVMCCFKLCIYFIFIIAWQQKGADNGDRHNRGQITGLVKSLRLKLTNKPIVKVGFCAKFIVNINEIIFSVTSLLIIIINTPQVICNYLGQEPGYAT